MTADICTRFAVVIGNNQYAEQTCPDTGECGYARDMEEQLVNRGFEVSVYFNLDAAGIAIALHTFCEHVRGRRQAGHGCHEVCTFLTLVLPAS